MRELWLEGGGGENSGESNCLAHAFAGLKTSHDAKEKRGKRGFLFTVCDGPVHDGVERDQLARVLGVEARRGITGREAVRLASEAYDVFHIILDAGYANYGMDRVRDAWLPERLAELDLESGLGPLEYAASNELLHNFLAECAAFASNVPLRVDASLSGEDALIFEGAQGLLLDQNAPG